MTNEQLSTATASLLRRLTVNGLHRDKDTAEHLIRELHARLCPQPPAKGNGSNPYQNGPSGPAGHPKYGRD